jgi:two-component system response regulator YesN
MAYQIFLVDDESIIRKGILSSINWSETGFEICGEASNGKEALELIPELHPDILITDIRMPIMDGLELATQVRKLYPKIKIVIISGYDDFQYAQRAIRLGVENFLLKPVGATELIEEIRRIGTKLATEEANHQQKIADLLVRERYQSLKAQFVQDLIRSSRKGLAQIELQAKALNLPFEPGYWLAMIVSIDDYQFMSDDDRDLDRATLRNLVMNVVEEILQEAYPVIVAHDLVGQLVALVRCHEESISDLVSRCRLIQCHVQKILKISLTMGIGHSIVGPDDFYLSYHQALSAVRQKAYLGKGQVIVFQSSMEQNNIDCLYPTEQEKEIIEALRILNTTSLENALQQFIRNLNQTPVALPVFRQHCTRLLYIILSSVEEMGIDCRSLLNELGDPASRLSRYETLQDIENGLKQYLDRFSALIRQHRSARFSTFVREVIDFIRQHYAEDLTLSAVAEIVHITPNYLSKIFKEEMKCNFVDYLNKYRIEKARQLIHSQPEKKTYEIAEQVGFKDYKYFTFVFKKYTGKTPKECRE